MGAFIMLRETQALIAANGNIALAADELGVLPDKLISIIASDDPEGITTALKVATGAHTLDALTEVKQHMLERLDEFPPAILAKLFLALLDKSQAISLGQLPQQLTQNNDNRSWNLNMNDAGDDARNAIEGRINSLIERGQS